MTLLSLIPGPIGWAARIFAGGKSLVGGAVKWAGGSPVHLTLAVSTLVIACLGVHDYIGHRQAAKWHERADKAGEQVIALNKTIETMNALAVAAKTASNQKAKEADHEHTLALADASNAADRYIAAHRLRTDTSSGTPAQADGASLPAQPAAGAVMAAVTADDIHTCTDDHTYGNSVYLWMKSLVDDGRAEYAAPQPDR